MQLYAPVDNSDGEAAGNKGGPSAGGRSGVGSGGGNPSAGHAVVGGPDAGPAPHLGRVDHDGAFHRMLYVFACTSGACVNVAPQPSPSPASSSRPRLSPPGVVVLRTQLPRRNPFYPYASTATIRPPAAADAGAGDAVCALCGLPAPHRCSGCKVQRYCSRAHQLVHWKQGGHKGECGKPGASAAAATTAAHVRRGDGNGGDDELSEEEKEEERRLAVAVQAGALFPSYELVVETEPSARRRRRLAEKAIPADLLARVKRGEAVGSQADGTDATATAAAAAAAAAGGELAAAAAAATSGRGDAGEGEPPAGGDGSDGSGGGGAPSTRDLTRKELLAVTGAQLFADGTLRYFKDRVSCEPEQCLRYCRWPRPEPVQAAGAAAKSVGGTGTAAAAAEKSNNKEEEEEEEEIDSEDEEEAEAGEPFGAPLWFSRANQPPPAAAPGGGEDGHGAATPSPSFPPPCERCGAPRAFEFQVMPQLLNYVLDTDGSAGTTQAADLDFGTIAVYTCTRSCELAGTSGGRRGAAGGEGEVPQPCLYVPEVAWVQPSEETTGVAGKGVGEGVKAVS